MRTFVSYSSGKLAAVVLLAVLMMGLCAGQANAKWLGDQPKVTKVQVYKPVSLTATTYSIRVAYWTAGRSVPSYYVMRGSKLGYPGYYVTPNDLGHRMTWAGLVGFWNPGPVRQRADVDYYVRRTANGTPYLFVAKVILGYF